jgi:xanthine dehydrogenase YagR molybdenum-binding subunit
MLGAHRDGRLALIRHEVLSHTSVMEDYAEAAIRPDARALCVPQWRDDPAARAAQRGRAYLSARAGEATGTFRSKARWTSSRTSSIDPVELRLRNYAEVEPSSGKRWSSNRLRECYRTGASRFGWSRRTAEPRSMRDGRWLIGWGTAWPRIPRTACRLPHPSDCCCATVLPSCNRAPRTWDRTYTLMTQIAAEALGFLWSAFVASWATRPCPKLPYPAAR